MRNRLGRGHECAAAVPHGHGVDGRVHAAQVHIALLAQLEGRSVEAKVEMLYCCGWPATVLVLRAVAQAHQQHLRGIADHGGEAAVVMRGVRDR
jgi:hypothetical protein